MSYKTFRFGIYVHLQIVQIVAPWQIQILEQFSCAILQFRTPTQIPRTFGANIVLKLRIISDLPGHILIPYHLLASLPFSIPDSSS